MKINPIRNNVLVQRVTPIEKSPGGIIIPDAAKEKPVEGIVIAVGPGNRNEKNGELMPLEVKSGDRVLFGKYGGAEIELHGEKYTMLGEPEIMGIIEP